ncbi:MAG: hypothetical protein ACR2KB_06215 [Chitinophagaceae bacterium]
MQDDCKSELQNLGISSTVIELGEVETTEEISSKKLLEFKLALQRFGLALMEDKKTVLIEKIKTIIIEMIHYNDEPPLLNFSNFLSEKLNYDYNYLSNLFSEVKGTIEHYIIPIKLIGPKNCSSSTSCRLLKLPKSFITVMWLI